MRMRKSTLLLTLLSVLSMDSTAFASTVTIGDKDDARQGQTIEIPVSVSDTTDIAGLNIRMDYDPDVLGNVSVRPGPLMTAGLHKLDFHAPSETPGRFDVVVYSPEGVHPFSAQSGVVFRIVMRVNQDALPGHYDLAFASTRSASANSTSRSSGLSDAAGNSLAHEQRDGGITVITGLEGDLNGDGRMNQLDVFLFCEDWQMKPPRMPEADVDANNQCDVLDLLILMRLWRDQ